jgi:hypothetical protein
MELLEHVNLDLQQFTGCHCMQIKKHLNFTNMRHELSRVFNKIEDNRQKSKVTISIHDALMSGFACMYFQDPSLLQFQKRMQDDQYRNNLETLFGVTNIPKETIVHPFVKPFLKSSRLI